MPAVRGEHGGSGVWRIVEGTGRYATLCGQGTYTGTLTSGDPNLFETILYRTEWRGVVDFDADPPTIESFAATVRKLRQRVAAYTVRIGLTARDASLPISYTVDLRAGRTLARPQASLYDVRTSNDHSSGPPSARCPQCADSAYRVRRSRKRNEYLAGTPLAIARRTRVQRERACEESRISAIPRE